MMSASISDPVFAMLAIAFFTFLLAGFIKGVIGLGLPTVAIGLLGLVMTPAQAAALLIVPSLVTNVWQLAAGPALTPLLRRLWPMLAGFCIGTGLGGNMLANGANGKASMLLGIALMVYALIGLSSKRFSVPRRMETWLSPVVGIATGVVAAATGVFVVPAVPYMQALGLNKDELVQALGLSFTVSTVALAIVLTMYGSFQLSVAGASLLALLPAMLGMYVGQRLRSHVRAETFRVCFFGGLLLLGAHLAFRLFL